MHDITRRKAAEAEIRSKNQDLETLLYVTSHDLREPLRAIENFSRLVCERYADKLDAKGQDFLERVVQRAQRLDRLLEDVLTLSRVQRTVQPAEDVDAGRNRGGCAAAPGTADSRDAGGGEGRRTACQPSAPTAAGRLRRCRTSCRTP